MTSKSETCQNPVYEEAEIMRLRHRPEMIGLVLLVVVLLVTGCQVPAAAPVADTPSLAGKGPGVRSAPTKTPEPTATTIPPTPTETPTPEALSPELISAVRQHIIGGEYPVKFVVNPKMGNFWCSLRFKCCLYFGDDSSDYYFC